MHERRGMRSGIRPDISEDDSCYPRARRAGSGDCMKSRRRSSLSSRYDAEVGRELFDIFLCKSGYAVDSAFLSSSPPNRAGNPLVNDQQFVQDRCIRDQSFYCRSNTLLKTCAPVRASPSVRVEGFSPRP